MPVSNMSSCAEWIGRWLSAAILAVLVGAQVAGAEGRRFTVDDMLRLEGFGNAAFDPTGRWLIFEKIRPYEDIGDYSFRTYAFGKSGHQLWRYDLQSESAPEQLPGLDPEPQTYFQGFSPDGRFLLVVQYNFGQLALGAYDMRGETVRWFDLAPAMSRAGEYEPVWISDTEFVYAALPAGRNPADTSIRADVVKHLTEAWQNAWRGKTPTASEVRTLPEAGGAMQIAGVLIRANAVDGASTVLAQGLFADLRPSPDRRSLAALAVFPGPAETLDRLAGTNRLRHRLTLFDLGTGHLARLDQEFDFYPYTVAWSPGGERLAAFGWPDGEGPGMGRFRLIDRETGAASQLKHCGLDLASERERGWQHRPERAVFLNQGLAVFARPAPSTGECEALFTLKDVGAPGLEKSDWYLLTSENAPENLTRDLPSVSGVPIDTGEGGLIVCSGSGLYSVRQGSFAPLLAEKTGPCTGAPQASFMTRAGVTRPEFDGHALVVARSQSGPQAVLLDFTRQRSANESRTVLPPMADQPLAGSQRAGMVLYRSDEAGVSRLILVSGFAGQTREVARINAPLSSVAPGHWHTVSYSVPDSEGHSRVELESCVLTPAGTQPGASLPMIVDVYPGSRPSCRKDGDGFGRIDPHSPYLWAGLGYAYARIALPQELSRTPDGPIAGMDELVEAGVSAIVDAGIADADRIAVTGLSQGGASALYVAARTSRFRAVIAKNGFANFISHYFGGAGVYSVTDGDLIGLEAVRYDSLRGSDFGFGQTPFAVPEAYLRNSPVLLAPQIDIPVLLMHSDLDAFSLTQFDEMFGALRRAGKNARYVRYWGEGHSPSSPANIRDMWQRQIEFLNEAGVHPD